MGIDEDKDGKIHAKFEQLFNNVFPSTIRSYVSSEECEMIKYMRNCFLATKVSFCNEMEAFCRAKNVDYCTVREYATHDVRVGVSHTLVPGPDGKRGFSGSCFPKDCASLEYQMKSIIDCPIIQAVNIRNVKIDRSDADWTQEKGRAVL